jgi:hypothetical protein
MVHKKTLTAKEKKSYRIGSLVDTRYGEGWIVNYLPERKILVEYPDGQRIIHRFDKLP